MDSAYALRTTGEALAEPVTRATPPIWSLQLLKAERLRDLLSSTGGHEPYQLALHAYMEADRDLQKALVERFGLDTVL